MMLTKNLLMIGAAVALLVAGAEAQTLLFEDTFEGRVEGAGQGNGQFDGMGNGFSEWGTSSDGQIDYVVGPSRGGGRNQVVGMNQFDAGLGNHGFLFDGAAGADLGSLLASAPNGFQVSFDFDRFTDPALSANGYLAFGMGVDLSTATIGNFAAIGTTAFGVLFQQAANGNVGNARAFANGDTVDFGNTDYGDPAARHSAEITFTPAVAGSYGAGDTIHFSVSVDDNSLYNDSFVSNGEDMNQFVFSANDPGFNSDRYIDNLRISSVPEPGLGMLSFIAFGFMATRLRRS